MYVFDNNKYSPKNVGYNTLVKYLSGSLVFEVGDLPVNIVYEPKPRPVKKNYINVRNVRKEELEYYYGIYRMFPCGKQYQYHMQYMHVPGVTCRNIR